MPARDRGQDRGEEGRLRSGAQGNQGLLAGQVKDSFALLTAASVSTEVDCDHGWVEQRTCSVIGDLSLVEKATGWPALACLVRIDAERFHKTTGKTERETRFCISSLRPDAARLNSVIRQHWGIESKLHWLLDVAFREDHSRKRAGNAAQNFSAITKIAPNLLKQRNPPPEESRKSASKPPGARNTSENCSESDMRRPCASWRRRGGKAQ